MNWFTRSKKSQSFALQHPIKVSNTEQRCFNYYLPFTYSTNYSCYRTHQSYEPDYPKYPLTTSSSANSTDVLFLPKEFVSQVPYRECKTIMEVYSHRGEGWVGITREVSLSNEMSSTKTKELKLCYGGDFVGNFYLEGCDENLQKICLMSRDVVLRERVCEYNVYTQNVLKLDWGFIPCFPEMKLVCHYRESIHKSPILRYDETHVSYVLKTQLKKMADQ